MSSGPRPEAKGRSPARRSPPLTPVRALHCRCGRYLGKSTARKGWIVVKCHGCGTWQKLDFAHRVH